MADIPVLLQLFKEFFISQRILYFFAIIFWVATALALICEWNARPRYGENRLRISAVNRGERSILVLAGIPRRANPRRSRKLLPQKVDDMRDGKVTSLAVEQLVPGEVVLPE